MYYWYINSALLMYIIHGMLIATNLIITIIIVKFVRQIFRIESKIDSILKNQNPEKISDDSKNNKQDSNNKP